MRELNKKVWPFRADVDIHLHEKSEVFRLDEWCKEVFGVKHRAWYSYNIVLDKRTYAFKTEEDLLIFKLRYKTCSKV